MVQTHVYKWWVVLTLEVGNPNSKMIYEQMQDSLGHLLSSCHSGHTPYVQFWV